MSEREYRAALGAYATGVAVVTAGTEAEGFAGITINSFASVSLKPRLILWSLGDQSERYDQFAATERFGVSFLGADQKETAALCSKQGEQELADEHVEMLSGSPVLKKALTRLACRTFDKRVLGDHLVIVGEVLAFDTHGGDGLTYFRSAYGKAKTP